VKILAALLGDDVHGRLHRAGSSGACRAFIQDRLGPNRVGPFRPAPAGGGRHEVLSQGGFHPGHVRKIYFWLAPAIVMMPAMLTVAVIPFGSKIWGSRRWSSRT
jgi:NADH:ubiquinone oxidoreductase subunit H